MIKFFRKIRQKLLSENRFSKYLIYAIGEILLVVIGILIALQINNKNQFNQERKLESELLEQLHSEFKSNLDQLESKISTRKLMINSATKLLEYKDNKNFENRDSIIECIAFTYLAPTFDPIVNDLTSSGRIQLIRNSQLKESLSRWTSQIIQVTEVEKSWLEYRNKYYFPVLHENSSMRNIINHSLAKNSNQLLQSGKSNNYLTSIGNSTLPEDFSDLFNAKNFEDNLAFCALYSKVINSESEILKNNIIKLLSLIQKELDLLN
jgi:Family of unknown function (DUF6090)